MSQFKKNNPPREQLFLARDVSCRAKKIFPKGGVIFPRVGTKRHNPPNIKTIRGFSDLGQLGTVWDKLSLSYSQSCPKKK